MPANNIDYFTIVYLYSKMFFWTISNHNMNFCVLCFLRPGFYHYCFSLVLQCMSIIALTRTTVTTICGKCSALPIHGKHHGPQRGARTDRVRRATGMSYRNARATTTNICTSSESMNFCSELRTKGTKRNRKQLQKYTEFAGAQSTSNDCMIEWLYDWLKHFKYYEIHGTTPRRKRRNEYVQRTGDSFRAWPEDVRSR